MVRDYTGVGIDGILTQGQKVCWPREGDSGRESEGMLALGTGSSGIGVSEVVFAPRQRLEPAQTLTVFTLLSGDGSMGQGRICMQKPGVQSSSLPDPLSTAGSNSRVLSSQHFFLQNNSQNTAT